jgi:hypothetical protein
MPPASPARSQNPFPSHNQRVTCPLRIVPTLRADVTAVCTWQERARLTPDKHRHDLLEINLDRPGKPLHHRVAGGMPCRIETALPPRQIQARQTRFDLQMAEEL